MMEANPLVSLVLPRQQRTLALQAVGNNFQEKLLNRGAAKVVGGVTEFSSAFGGFAAGAVTGDIAVVGLGMLASPLAPLVAIPLVCGMAVAGLYTGASAADYMMDTLSNREPRVLGSPSTERRRQGK